MSQTNHLTRRSGVWYYRRRVPTKLVGRFQRGFVQYSLGTSSLTAAKKRRAVEDLKWSARFELAEKEAKGPSSPSAINCTAAVAGSPLTDREVIRIVQLYVAKADERAQDRLMEDPPENEGIRADMAMDAELGLSILQNPEDVRGLEWLHHARKSCELMAPDGATSSCLGKTEAFLHRGLAELQRRQIARIRGQHDGLFFDELFNPTRSPDISIAELADQYLSIVAEDATANGTSQKWVDKQSANVALLLEIIGPDISVSLVDYDVCLRVRSLLARTPIHRTKLCGSATLKDAVALAEAEGRPVLSSVTQGQYLATLCAMLDLAAKKRLVPNNPAEGIRPLKKDGIAPSAKRQPFTPEQLKAFFEGAYYQRCAQHMPPYKYDKSGWRFWLPLMCLFMGMRPNEACQMQTGDVRRTTQGTWFLDIVATADDEETPKSPIKTVKTASSRRQIPIHPQLLKMGFLKFAHEHQGGDSKHLFPDLKPDSYGNHAKYALKRFREKFLPQEFAMQSRQSFYSFRHNFRDALRQIGAPPDALQALGGWSQGSLVSDAYGDKANPDYQKQFLERVEFPSINLEPIYDMRGG